MKNREKHREEIIKAIKSHETCEFMIKTVNPVYSDGWECNDELCQRDECEACLKLFAFWLDEEYIEPPKPEVDWSKVPVDTLVRVRNSVSEDWRLMYFKEYYRDYHYMYETWADGKTSKTAEGEYSCWNYCELVEDEDNDK